METKKKKGKLNNDPDERPRVVKCPADLQRLRLEKLMKNPEKPVIIPERPKGKNMPTAPDFVRNVMGSSAGAGSGEFHVYRHLRRKEYARQKFIQDKGEKEIMEDEYHQKLEDNKRKSEKQTAKKRAKRLKKKQNAKAKGKKPKVEYTQSVGSNSDSEEKSNSEDENKSNDKIESKKNEDNKVLLQKNNDNSSQETNEQDDN